VFVRLKWPLVGRVQELRVIEAAISDSERSGIIICGAAGVGKSRVAREALQRAQAAGRAIRWAVGTSSARELPLGAFESWAPTAVPDNLQLVRGAIESLMSVSPGTTVIVGVDDAHLLDDLSIFVLHQVVQRRGAKLALTVRDGEPAQNSRATREDVYLRNDSWRGQVESGPAGHSCRGAAGNLDLDPVPGTPI
jgi:hypothetical protein